MVPVAASISTERIVRSTSSPLICSFFFVVLITACPLASFFSFWYFTVCAATLVISEPPIMMEESPWARVPRPIAIAPCSPEATAP